MEKDICAAFSKLPYDIRTYPFKPENVYNDSGRPIKVHDLINQIEAFQPHFIMGINGNCCDPAGHLSRYYLEKGFPVITWYVDKPYLKDFEGDQFIPENTLHFFIDRYYCRYLKASKKFPYLYHLPLGTNLLDDSEKEQQTFKQDLSFVGRSNLNKIQMILSRLSQKDAGFLKEMESLIDRIGRDYFESPMTEIFEILNPGNMLEAYQKSYPDREYEFLVNQLIEELVSYKKRMETLDSLKGYDLKIFGDHRWREAFPDFTVVTHPDPTWEFPFPYGSEALKECYVQTKINLNITRYQIRTGMNQRVLDIPAVGGFLITDDREEIPELFEPDKEIICYRDTKDLNEKVAYYLSHPEKREEIIRAAQKRVRKEHTYEHRMRTLVHTALKAKAQNVPY